MTVPLTAERARDRLDRGLPELARAGDDPAILSYALSALHGALEAHFRSVLASDSRVPAEIRAVALDVGALSFVDIANALHDHLDLPASERSYILDAHGYHDLQDHGDGFAWDRAGLEGYARYVARKLGEAIPELDRPPRPLDAPEVSPDRPPAPEPPPLSSIPAPPVAAVPVGGGRWAGLGASRPFRALPGLAGLAGLRGHHLIFILGALVAVSLLWSWVDSAAFDAGSRAARSPVATPQLPVVASSPAVPASAQGGLTASPVAVRSPAAVQKSAPTPTRSSGSAASSGDWLVVGNTDGEGVFLRRTPSLEDRLEPYDDGTRMQAVGPEVESEGRRWRLVRLEDGTVGWVPSQYLVPERSR